MSLTLALDASNSPARVPANDDLGAASAVDLWRQVEAVESCVDLSDDESLERSLYRFPPQQRRLLAALWYLAIVERDGHAVYFRSEQARLVEDAIACFVECGAEETAELIEEARAELSVGMQIAVGQSFATPISLGIMDARISSLDPIDSLRRYRRRWADAFDRW